MFEIIKFLGDIPGPYPYYEPDPIKEMGLMPYIIGGFVVIVIITVRIVLLKKQSKKKGDDKKDE